MFERRFSNGIVHGICFYSLAVSSLAAYAQGVTIYAPIEKSYTLGNFTYESPTTDGWRQISTTGNTLIMVYAETAGEEQINTRAQIETESFAAPPGAITGDVLWLAEQGHAQQVKERGENLQKFSAIEPIQTNANVMRYVLTTRIGAGEELIEVFYVTLAADKTDYLVAKLSTKDTDYETQPYLVAFEASLATLSHTSGKSAPPPSADEASPRGA